MQLLKQSTAATIKLGPFVDDADGKTAETELTISQADIRLSKNGGNIAQSNNSAGATHDELGYYDVPLDATDTGTLGRLDVIVSESGALPCRQSFMVVPANVYDSLVGGSDSLKTKLVQQHTPNGGKIWYVNASASGDGTGYNPTDAFTTIAAGEAAMSDFDTLVIAAGTYTEQVTFDKDNTTIIGAGGTATEIKIDAAASSGNYQALRIRGDNVTAIGIYANSQKVATSGVGIDIDGTTGVTIDSCVGYGPADGLYGANSKNAVIRNSRFTSSYDGGNMIDAQQFLIENCLFETDGSWTTSNQNTRGLIATANATSINDAVTSGTIRNTDFVSRKSQTTTNGKDVVGLAVSGAGVKVENCRVVCECDQAGFTGEMFGITAGYHNLTETITFPGVVNVTGTTIELTNAGSATPYGLKTFDAASHLYYSDVRFSGIDTSDGGAIVETALKPTSAGRTLDVTDTGEAGIDLGNVGNAGSTLDLSGTTISSSQVVASVTGNVGGTINGLTSTAVGHIWNALTSALTTGSSIGKLLVDMLNATVGSRLAADNYTTPPSTSAIVAAVEASTPAATFFDNQPGGGGGGDPSDWSSIKSTITTNLDAKVSTRSSHSVTDIRNDIEREGGALLQTQSYASSGATSAGVAQTNTNTLTSRLTSDRAGYLDKLNISGNVASSAEISAINQSASRRVMLVNIQQFERPESGSVAFEIEARTYDGDGAATNADSTPTLTATGSTSGSLAANLGTATNPATGVYRWAYTVASNATLEQIRFDLSATIASSTFTISSYAFVCDFVATTFTAADRSALNALPSAADVATAVAGSTPAATFFDNQPSGGDPDGWSTVAAIINNLGLMIDDSTPESPAFTEGALAEAPSGGGGEADTRDLDEVQHVWILKRAGDGMWESTKESTLYLTPGTEGVDNFRAGFDCNIPSLCPNGTVLSSMGDSPEITSEDASVAKLGIGPNGTRMPMLAKVELDVDPNADAGEFWVKVQVSNRLGGGPFTVRGRVVFQEAPED